MRTQITDGDIQVNRVLRIPGQKVKTKGGKLSKKYRKINLKSKRHYKRANKVTKKKRKMMGGYIANYSSSSSKGRKTKKVKSSSKSSSHK